MKANNAAPLDAILFDLDGTLLRVQMAEFIPRYVEGLASCFTPYAKPKKFARVMLGAIRGLIRDEGDGQQTNQQRVYSILQQHLAIPQQAAREAFQSYAAEQLDSLQELVQPIPLARQILLDCQQRGIKLVLATNPVFPAFMIQARLRWGDLEDIHFSHLTSTENSCYCKPQSGYFREIVEQLQLAPENCMMVGNDTLQDLSAAAVGIETFLVDTWVVEREGRQWSSDHRGNHDELRRFLHARLA